MGEEFAEFYQSRCRFTQRYIDCLLISKGKGNFVWAVFCRACRFYGQPFVFSLSDVEKHLGSKLSCYEIQIIKAEKERRSQTPVQRFIKDNTASMARFARIMDVMTLRTCGYTYRDIGEELGMSRDVARQLLQSARGYGFRGEIKYVLRVLRVIEGLDAAKDSRNF